MFIVIVAIKIIFIDARRARAGDARARASIIDGVDAFGVLCRARGARGV